jgi:hypothetical protein
MTLDNITPASEAERAGANVNDLEFEIIKHAIAERIKDSPEDCYNAGQVWSSKRFNKLRGEIVEGVTKDSQWAYRAWKNWEMIRLHFTARPIVKSISSNPKYSWEVIHSLAESRRHFFNRYSPRNSLWGLLIRLPKSEMKVLDRVYELAEKAGAEDNFHASWPTVLRKDNLHQWSKTIIKHFEENTIGGDTYRIA